MAALTFITISRQTGSLGRDITELLAGKLELPVISRDLVINQWLPEIAGKHELHMLAESPGFYLNASANGLTFAEFIENKLRAFIAEQPAIIFGLGAQIIFSRHPAAIHVKVMASQDVRTQRIMQRYGMGESDARRFLEITDRKHKRYISTIYKKDWSDPALYHIILNTDFITIEESVSLLYDFTRKKEINTPPPAELTDSEAKKPVLFKHSSEEEFAKILDMYNIEWEYEPRTFPIKWDEEGNITLAFSPDFYLPRFNTFIELTTMNQKYASQKKKKVELLKTLYPGTNINIVFKKDFYTLLKRFKLKEGSK
ncbi:MAG TPA: cytidylate kinase family protein [Desulfitobacteriaceae bacterium]|nr:cytidylate kinase family protein [Desulfitobacteriaceae bacterium]